MKGSFDPQVEPSWVGEQTDLKKGQRGEKRERKNYCQCVMCTVGRQ